MKTIFAYLFAALFAFTTTAGGKKEKVTIQTSAQCGACEKRITTALQQVEGFKTVKFNDTKEVVVTFDKSKTNADAFRNAIAAVGYDADTKTANTEAYSNLPQCCQKGGHD